MKKTVLAIIGLSMSYLLMAQEPAVQPVAEQTPAKQKEIGLVFNNLNRFGLTFRIGTEKSMWRFRSVVLSTSDRTETNPDNDEEITSSGDAGFEIAGGKEFRMGITDKMDFRLGGDVSLNAESSLYKDERYERTQYLVGCGANVVIGLNYNVNEHFVVGAELLPFIQYAIGERKINRNNGILDANYDEENSDIEEMSFGVTNNSALLSLVYRF